MTLRSTGTTGPAHAMHGFGTAAFDANSDYAQQGILQEQFVALARQVDENISHMQTLKSFFLRKAGVSSTAGYGDSYAVAAQKALSKAKRLIVKAESGDPEDREDGETDEDVANEIERLLKKVKRLLLQSHEADEAETDDVAASYSKAKASLAVLKAKVKPVATATAKAGDTTATDAAAAKAMTRATQAIGDQADSLQRGLSDVVALLHQRGGQPAPMSHILAKAANSDGPAIPSNRQIAEMLEAGQLTSAAAMEAKMLRSILHQGERRKSKAESRSARTKVCGCCLTHSRVSENPFTVSACFSLRAEKAGWLPAKHGPPGAHHVRRAMSFFGSLAWLE
jgi:hypothetical protein